MKKSKIISFFIFFTLLSCNKTTKEEPVVEQTPLYPCSEKPTQTFGCDILPNIPCSEATIDSIDSRCLIVGTWDWAYEGPDMMNHYKRTPQNTGKRYRLIFRKDGMVQHYRNDTLMLVSAYKLNRYVLNYMSKTCNYSGIGYGTKFWICNDSLFFDYVTNDLGGMQVWARKKP